MTHPNTYGRELALQYLYMYDLLSGVDVQPLNDYLSMQDPAPKAEALALTRTLVDAVLQHLDELDQEIAASAHNWSLRRMAIVDRNILRLGLAELIACPESPYPVIINEAVDLARRYSSEAACGFVNGLLDKIRLKYRAQEVVIET